MGFIFIDRRKAGRGKSMPNRQKLLDRLKKAIKQSKHELIAQGVGSIKDASGNTKMNPIKVAGSVLEEPFFAYGDGGRRKIVLVGNDRFERGDPFPLEELQSENDQAGGHGEDVTDDFIVHVSKDEFLDYFFEDCVLPNLDKTREQKIESFEFQRAGFTNTGAPATLSIPRSYQKRKQRTTALTVPWQEEIRQLEEELAEIDEQLEAWSQLEKAELASPNHPDITSLENRRIVIIARIEELHAKIESVTRFDKIDLKFKRRERRPLKAVDAVLLMFMDVSGSMSKDRKEIARRFFSLLYNFIKRKYANTDLIFITHTDTAEEVKEDEFFNTPRSGGTTASSGVILAKRLISERYDVARTNIYVAQASDGENTEDDNELLKEELVGRDGLLNSVQHMCYIEINDERRTMWGGQVTYISDIYKGVGAENLSVQKLTSKEDIFQAFHNVFGKTGQPKAEGE